MRPCETVAATGASRTPTTPAASAAPTGEIEDGAVTEEPASEPDASSQAGTDRSATLAPHSPTTTHASRMVSGKATNT